MTPTLSITVGQHTDAGLKSVNQDCHGVHIPGEPLLSNKGIACAIADGISSSQVSEIASETAVTNFLQDYFCTSDAWSVKTAGHKVLSAINSWLFAQTRNSPHRFNKDKGYICAFSAMILKSTTAHLFHSGDTRIYRLTGNRLEPLTNDHRQHVSADTSYLSRALGIHHHAEIDYASYPIDIGDTFVMATDGVHEYLCDSIIISTIENHTSELNNAAKQIIDAALAAGSKDNLTLQIVRIDNLPNGSIDEVHQKITALPLPPALEPRMTFDGFTILREIYISSRSHV